MVRKGFTLIELLVVIAIVAILAAILFPVFSAVREKARATSCLSNSRQLGMAVAMYVQDWNEFFPTVRMPHGHGHGTSEAESWVDLMQPYSRNRLLHRCPSDTSPAWNDMHEPRTTSYGMNAYFDPYHPPYGDHHHPRPFSLASVAAPSKCVFSAELAEFNSKTGMAIKGDHFMPMYWGNPPRVNDPMMNNMLWDSIKSEPTTLAIRRHQGGSNYAFVDGHAKWLLFQQTWRQIPGNPPIVDFYDPLKP